MNQGIESIGLISEENEEAVRLYARHREAEKDGVAISAA